MVDVSRRPKKGRDRYRSLLISLIVLLVAYPIVKELRLSNLYAVLLAGQLVVSAYSIGDSKAHLWMAVSLCVPGVGLQILSVIRPTRGAMVIGDIAVAIFLAYVIVVVYKAVLRQESIDENRIAGAISVYLLIGIFWAVVYNVIAFLKPESFSDFEMYEVGGIILYSGGADFLYLSFVTLTTLGYGDITPSELWSRTAAWTEAVVGQLYVAITIASLVGVKVAEVQAKARETRRSKKDMD